MAVDPFDPLERLAGQREQGELDRNADLTDDPDPPVVELLEQVVRLADRARERALDRHDAGAGIALGHGLEDGAPRRDSRPSDVGSERPEHRLLREGAGLTL